MDKEKYENQIVFACHKFSQILSILKIPRSPFPFPDSPFLILKIASVDDKHKSKFCRGKVSFAVADVGSRKDLARIDKNKYSV